MRKKIGASIVLLLVPALLLSGCAGMSPTEQRVLSGGAIGAAGGAVIGAAAGNPVAGAAIGGAAGVVGGIVVDQMEKSRHRDGGY